MQRRRREDAAPDACHAVTAVSTGPHEFCPVMAVREGAARKLPLRSWHCWQPHSLTDLVFGSPHELSRGSVCMLDNEIRAALAEMDEEREVVQTSIHGRSATALLQHSEHATLLVLGAHGHLAIRDVVMGEIVATCSKHAFCPVVVVDADNHAVTYGQSRNMVAAHSWQLKIGPRSAGARLFTVV